jgi:hypothetical protein
LWRLLFLHFRGSLRRRLRSLRTLRGWLLTLIGLGFVGGWVLLASHRSPLTGQETMGGGSLPANAARDVFPPVLLLACLMTVAVSSGPAIYFSRAEIDFLFTGPFSRRGLLLYKFLSYATGAFVSALCISAVVPFHSRLWAAAFLGTFLTLVFLQLFAAVVGLMGQTLAAPVHRRLRWAFVGLGLLVLAGLVWQTPVRAAGGGTLAALQAARNSAVGQLVFAPFEVYARVVFAENARDLAVWAVLAAGLDALLLAGLIWLDAEYYEAVEAVSQRRRQRWRQWHRGRLVVEPAAVAGMRIPQLPRWGGAGPLAWRQLTTAARTSRRTLSVMYLAAACTGPALMAAVRGGLSVWSAAAILLTVSAVLVPRVLLFDFRGDLEHLDYLKTLPFRPSAVVLGQAMTPILLSISVQAVILGGAFLAASDAGQRRLLGVALPMIVPFHCFHYAVENLIFLWFPWRVVPVGRMDFEFFGRTLLETMGKLTASLGCWLAGALLATVIYRVSGESRIVALGSCWLFVMACSGLVTWVAAWRFRRLDVVPRGRG